MDEKLELGTSHDLLHGTIPTAVKQPSENGSLHGGFEDLLCWQACRELRLFIVKQIVPQLPPDERFRLADQMIRAARSTAANIAEGHGRFHYADSANFCSHARGSVQEVLDHIIAAHDEDLLEAAQLEKARTLVTTATKLINGYRAYLLRAKRQS